MKPSLRKSLDIIDRWLLDPDIGRDLTHVLSALRGPDTESDDDLKLTTTNHIRRAAFPRLAERYDKWYDTQTEQPRRGALSCWDLHVKPPRRIETKMDDPDDLSHFMSHVLHARKALGHNKVTGETVKKPRARRSSKKSRRAGVA